MAPLERFNNTTNELGCGISLVSTAHNVEVGFKGSWHGGPLSNKRLSGIHYEIEMSQSSVCAMPDMQLKKVGLFRFHEGSMKFLWISFFFFPGPSVSCNSSNFNRPDTKKTSRWTFRFLPLLYLWFLPLHSTLTDSALFDPCFQTEHC